MKTPEELLRKIHQSGLAEADVALWQQVIPVLTVDDVAAFLQIIDETPNELIFLTSMLRRKWAALQAHDQAAWQAIIQEELGHLQSIPD